MNPDESTENKMQKIAAKKWWNSLSSTKKSQFSRGIYTKHWDNLNLIEIVNIYKKIRNNFNIYF